MSSVDLPEPVEHPVGGFYFVPGISPYSGGVRATSSCRIVNVTSPRALEWKEGFEHIDAVLAASNRPPSALCSIVLRCPKPESFDGFRAFNDEYRAALDDRSLLLDGINPIARTNVAPIVDPPAETLMYGFGYTIEQPTDRPSFVIAGAGDLHDQADLSPEAIVRAGDRWIEAGSERATVVLDEMETRMAALGVDWGDAMMVNVYTAEPLHHVLQSTLLRRMGPAATHGVHWHLAAPPVAGLTFEMDLRGGTTEMWH
jgi:hypothetical protein